MKILFIYPHPDDESFGPAAVMHNLARNFHDVHLLTLTKGGATKERLKYKYSIKKMGEVRHKEMMKVAEVLRLKSITVLDFPDGELKELDPRDIESAIKDVVLKIEPYVIVSYPVHGISGYYDHLVTHAAVKRVYTELKEKKWFLRRLAFTTVDEKTAKLSKSVKLNFSKEDEIDCVIHNEEIDLNAAHSALDCYKTYKDVVESSGIRKLLAQPSYFEFFNENFEQPVNDLLDKLSGN